MCTIVSIVSIERNIITNRSTVINGQLIRVNCLEGDGNVLAEGSTTSLTEVERISRVIGQACYFYRVNANRSELLILGLRLGSAEYRIFP